MNRLLTDAIQRWRSQRNRKMLRSTYTARYAFVGVGSHALQNLYPALQYLGLRLKYICCRNPSKLSLIEQRFGVTATTSLDSILNDDEVKGVFLCASPQAHYDICLRVIESGKHLFVEKPPCRTLDQLNTLISIDKQNLTMVGMQKRYSPLIQSLQKRLTKEDPISYSMTYLIGAYPEGNPFTNLFIHPVDLALHLFGPAKLKAVQRVDRNETVSLQVMLSHESLMGVIELSTAYSWNNPKETIRINTTSGYYHSDRMEQLCYSPHPKRVIGIPLEKIGIFTVSEQILAQRNNFSPLIVNNQIHTQGFLPEIEGFAEIVEYSGQNKSPLTSLRPTYELLSEILKQH